jgi:hypothetical protein
VTTVVSIHQNRGSQDSRALADNSHFTVQSFRGLAESAVAHGNAFCLFPIQFAQKLRTGSTAPPVPHIRSRCVDELVYSGFNEPAIGRSNPARSDEVAHGVANPDRTFSRQLLLNLTHSLEGSSGALSSQHPLSMNDPEPSHFAFEVTFQ